MKQELPESTPHPLNLCLGRESSAGNPPSVFLYQRNFWRWVHFSSNILVLLYHRRLSHEESHQQNKRTCQRQPARTATLPSLSFRQGVFFCCRLTFWFCSISFFLLFHLKNILIFLLLPNILTVWRNKYKRKISQRLVLWISSVYLVAQRIIARLVFMNKRT